MEEAKAKTNIQISVEFRDWLERHGTKAETYENILRRLVDYPNYKKEGSNDN